MESELQDHESGISDHYHHLHHHQHHSNHLQQQQHHRHHPPQQRESPAVGGHNNLLLGPSATLGRHSGRFGSRKSPFQVVIPSGAAGGHNKLTCPPPVCSTPQGGASGGGGDSMLPILGALGSPNRALPEFSTFGSNGGGYLTKFRGDEERNSGVSGGSLEPSGHLVW